MSDAKLPTYQHLINHYDPTKHKFEIDGQPGRYRFPVGIWTGVPEEIYFASQGYSTSNLKDISVAPALYLSGENETTTSQAFGKAFHTAILEPGEMDKRFTHSNEHGGSNAWKGKVEAASLAGKIHMKTAEYEDALEMARLLKSRPGDIADLAKMGDKLLVEICFYWIDPVTGLLCRGRADLACLEAGFAGDMKSCADANDAFMRSVRTYKYHWQNVHYMNGLTACGVPMNEFIFYAVEKRKPYLYKALRLPNFLLEHARNRVAVCLRMAAECDRTGDWFGYPAGVTEMHYPESWVSLYD